MPKLTLDNFVGIQETLTWKKFLVLYNDENGSTKVAETIEKDEIFGCEYPILNEK